MSQSLHPATFVSPFRTPQENESGQFSTRRRMIARATEGCNSAQFGRAVTDSAPWHDARGSLPRHRALSLKFKATDYWAEHAGVAAFLLYWGATDFGPL